MPSCGNSYFRILEAQLISYNQNLKWKSIEPELQEKLAEFYDFDLSKVRYAENVDMNISFDAFTYNYHIYFKGEMKFRLLAHELEHVSQFLKDPLFLDKYLLSTLSVLKIHKNLSIKSIHARNDYEKDASRKAQSLPFIIGFY